MRFERNGVTRIFLRNRMLNASSLRQKRQERMKAASDEALVDLDGYTVMLAAKRK